ncbi:hypothetical protein VOLCADRAFT_92124 [Volvox carteri f. nagariensis]|uniref:PDZ domain-containing protein n=1 Tax=Volvox carteri f. nagariensis TaxID=3068 RepID=D8TYN6_VOLCA|nr:uncharacterized protein VOLCADRAFT_92124 [Volvox carteri f. nagariensis]EFJ47344.1 hypothetical protein VOLCADRAFT_92124 [Volvox carteri f. nagariensis]|eukprot:XP_002951533.1 hypothetical protein VOLCADRAFT_92124 [Volvox carteri f. nagariensis]
MKAKCRVSFVPFCCAGCALWQSSRHVWLSTRDRPGLKEIAKRIAAAALGTTTALSLILSPAFAASELVRLPASTDPVIFAAQRTLVEAWTIVGQAFVDPRFNGHDWEGELREHMMAAFNAEEPEAAFGEIGRMLGELGDPYTRRVPPEEYAAFRVSSEGELQGVGMLIANEPINGHLLVLAPIKGGPADRAGILPGDELTSINGMSMEGWNGEKAARLLRGKGGTEVHVRLARRTGGIPGVPARPDPPTPAVEYREVSLRRERVQLSPLFSAALPAANLPPGTGGVMPVGTDGRVRQPDGPVGYLRLTSFSSNAASEMRDAIQELEAAGASSYILDLRNNPGGLVRSSIDIARLWLDGSPVVFNISSREVQPDEVQSQRVDLPGAALTHRPLVVLVNAASASASEILTGALHDNHRALVVGDSHTYGKGKIQSVFELQDGSALFVTVARYQTPNGTEIDRVGLAPDRSCALPALPTDGADGGFRSGLPMVPGSEEALLESLADDQCVVAAREVLREEVAMVANAARVAADIVRPVSSYNAICVWWFDIRCNTTTARNNTEAKVANQQISIVDLRTTGSYKDAVLLMLCADAVSMDSGSKGQRPSSPS